MQPVIDVIITMYARIAHQLPFCNTCTRACVYSCAHLLYAMSLCYYPRALSLYFFTYIHNTYIYYIYYIIFQYMITKVFLFFLSIQLKNSIKFNRDCKKSTCTLIENVHERARNLNSAPIAANHLRACVKAIGRNAREIWIGLELIVWYISFFLTYYFFFFCFTLFLRSTWVSYNSFIRYIVRSVRW